MNNGLQEAVRQALGQVMEPDLGESIVDLGLVRGLRVDRRGHVAIDITMVSLHSPHAAAITDQARRAALCAGATSADVQLVWQPAWMPWEMAESLRQTLGLPDREPEPPAPWNPPASWRSRLRGVMPRSGR